MTTFMKNERFSYLFRNCSESIHVVILEVVFLSSVRSPVVRSGVHCHESARALTISGRRFSGHWKPFQVRIEDWEICVILFENPNCRSLNWKLTYCVTSRFAVRRANNFDVKSDRKKGKKLFRFLANILMWKC